jgi:Domain of unknown function (DUF4190)
MTEYPPGPTPPGGYPPPVPPPGGGYPGYPGYSAYPGGYPPSPAATNGMAIASLVCSLVGLLCGLGLPLGIIFGFVALSQIKQSSQAGRGLALAGIIIGFVALGIGLIFWTIIAATRAYHQST